MVAPQHGGRRFHPQRLLRFTHAVCNLLGMSRVDGVKQHGTAGNNRGRRGSAVPGDGDLPGGHQAGT